MLERPLRDRVETLFIKLLNTAAIDDPLFDLGVITIAFNDEYADWYSAPSIQEQSNVQVGDEVGVFGYPFGTEGLVRIGCEVHPKRQRGGPVLSRGHISAIAPSPVYPIVDRYLLDAQTHGGMSGGPVFSLPSCLVVGIHTGGIGSMLAFANPLSHERTEAMILYGTDIHAALSNGLSLPKVRNRG